MTTHHTPGPWTWAGIVPADEQGRAYLNVGAESGPIVARLEPADTPIARANARLIAAAPDLLAAAEIVLDWYGSELDTEWCQLADAVDKAKGVRS